MSQQVNTSETDWSIRLWAYDSGGAAVTGLVYNSTGIAVSVVVRAKGRIVSTTALTLVARSSAGVHTDSAFTEVGNGEYVVDLPDSYMATAERTISLTVAATAITGTVIVETLEVGRAAVLDSAVQDQLDAIQAAAESGGGDALESTSQLILDNVNSLIGLSGAATLPPDGYVDGITEPITIGDDYIEGLNRRIVLSLIDSAGDPADTAWGDYSLDDVGISIKMLLHPSGRSTVTKSLSGDCEFVAAIGDIPSKLYVSLPRTETVKAVAGSYDLQVEAVWSDGATRTFLPFGKVNFVKDIRRT